MDGPSAGAGSDAGSDAGVDVVVDAANAVGSRPDGWWRDRAGASARLLAQLSRLASAVDVVGPQGRGLRVVRVHAVLEGRARSARPSGLHDGVEVVLAQADGDSAVVALAQELHAAGRRVLVVTADRGLRDRLPAGVSAAGPGWLRGLLDELAAGPG